ncbi:MAG: hypothetical protein P1V81_08460, partial [Planctomycetota bacterium]|nr:hypothetical protein [Planctomycetota bacterium]
VVLSPLRFVNAWTLGGSLVAVALAGPLLGRTWGAASGSEPAEQDDSDLGATDGATSASSMHSDRADSTHDRASTARAATSRAGSPSALRDWLWFLPALLVVGLTVHLALLRPAWNVDAQRRWVLHGQWTAEYDTATPAELELPAMAASHPSYPPLVTGLVALALDLGADRSLGVRPLFPPFLLALLAVVFGFARRRAGPLVAGATTLALALVPAFSHTDRLGLGAGAAHADIALAAYLTAAAALVLAGLDRGRHPGPGEPNLGRLCPPGAWSVAALVVVGAAWTKNEGLVFVAAMLLGSAVWSLLFGSLRRHAQALAGLTLVAMLAGAAWKLVARDMPVAEGEDYVSGSILAVVVEGLDRLPTILARLGTEFTDLGLWGPAWLVGLTLALVASLLPRPSAPLARRLLPTLWLAGGLALVVAAYMATGWKDSRYETLMDVSLARLVAHHLPLVALLLVEALTRPASTPD